MSGINPNQFFNSREVTDFVQKLRNASYYDGLGMIQSRYYEELLAGVIHAARKDNKSINEADLEMTYDLTCAVAAQLRLSPNQCAYYTNPILSDCFVCPNSQIQEIQNQSWATEGAYLSSRRDIIAKFGIAMMQVFPYCGGSQRYYSSDEDSDRDYRLVYPVEFKSDAPQGANGECYPLPQSHITAPIDPDSEIGLALQKIEEEKKQLIAGYAQAKRNLAKKEKKLLASAVPKHL